jgi:hypothetical protein
VKLKLEKEIKFYALTAGFQDQFEEPKGKKFMLKNRREYILSIAHLSMQEQHQSIATTFVDWKADLEHVISPVRAIYNPTACQTPQTLPLIQFATQTPIPIQLKRIWI